MTEIEILKELKQFLSEKELLAKWLFNRKLLQHSIKVHETYRNADYHQNLHDPNETFELYRENYRKALSNNPEDLIKYSFVWAYTTEGQEVWQIASYEWINYFNAKIKEKWQEQF